MASAQDRAISLKNNYVSGLIEGGVTAPVQGMKNQSFGNVAGAFEDRMVAPTPNNPHGFPDSLREGESLPEGFMNWDSGKQNDYFNLPMNDV